jgi:AcrR family transcriptional regulator
VSPLARRTQHADDARLRGEAALLDAAEALVAEGTPLGDLGIETIASRAGYSRATFYAYFPDKRALVLKLGERMVHDLEQAADGWLREGRGQLRDTLEAVLAVFERHRGGVAAIVESATYDNEVAAFWRDLHERFLITARDRIRKAQPRPTPAQAEARAFVLVWSTERCLTEHLAAPRVREGALLDALELQWTAALGALPGG